MRTFLLFSLVVVAATNAIEITLAALRLMDTLYVESWYPVRRNKR
jgi:hypothetical protein